MKPSHYTTPRTLSECNFSVGYSSAKPKRDPVDTLMIVGCCVLYLALLVLWVGDWLPGGGA